MGNGKEERNWDQIAGMLKAIAHPVRLAILEELCKGAKCVLDVHQIVDVSQPNLSQHLAALKKARLVGSYSSGPLRCYYLFSPAHVKKLIEIFKENPPVETRSRESIVREAQRTQSKTTPPLKINL